MISDLSIGLPLYESGEVDNIDLTESNLTTITSDSNNAHNAYLARWAPPGYDYQIHLNFQRKDDNGNLDENWNKAVANYAFRQCFYKGLNLVNYYARTNKINPLKCENDFYTMPASATTPRVRSTPLWWPRRWAWTAKLTTARP